MKLSRNVILALFFSAAVALAVSGPFVSAGDVEVRTETLATSEQEHAEAPEAVEEKPEEHVTRSQRSSQATRTKKSAVSSSLKIGAAVAAILAALGAGYSMMGKSSEGAASAEQEAADMMSRATAAFESPATSPEDGATKRSLKKFVSLLGGGAAAVAAAALAYHLLQQGLFDNLMASAPQGFGDELYDNATFIHEAHTFPLPMGNDN